MARIKRGLNKIKHRRKLMKLVKGFRAARRRNYRVANEALLHSLAGSDPARFHHIEGRFSSPVLPGDALTISAWVVGDGEAVFQTAKQDGTVVIDRGVVLYR